ncbi:DUF4253 domain-containing protein [Streptomyces sp. NPDC015232]|uniref:DUF4253 domain-containing protein n=1 Tax=unclassified Streptomyces TaxID=2593676 RepID=UPI0036FAFC0D
MTLTVTELRQLCDERAVPLPALREAATATDGSPVYVGEVAGVDAFRLWCALRDLHGHTGWWPVLAGDPEKLGSVLVGLRADFGPGPAGPTRPEILSEGVTDEAVRQLAAHVAAEVDLARVGGLHVSAVRQVRTTLCLVRASAGHEVPALLNWLGACNYDLAGTDHALVLRTYHERFGAELVTLESDILELLVPRRPTTPETVARTALEHYAYCPDIVDQGVDSVEALAATQLLAGTWHFWWD